MKELDSKVTSLRYIGQRKRKLDSHVFPKEFVGCYLDEDSQEMVEERISIENVKEMFSEKYVFFSNEQILL